MATTLLTALIVINKAREKDLSKFSLVGRNQPRVNEVGDPLDKFIKDALCGSFFAYSQQRNERYDEEFSHYGDQNNPPDIIIRNSDAIEVKKVGMESSELQLNSSYPKSKLMSDDLMLTEQCRNCEGEKGWKEKDMVYAVGHVDRGNILRVLTFVYGDCFVANTKLYKEVRENLVKEIKSLNFPFSETKELGRMNKIDPSEVTKLRIRGMWIIKSPLKVFSDIMKPSENQTSVFTLMRKKKYESFGRNEASLIEKEMDVRDVKIKDPDNLKKLIDAKLISFYY